MILFYAVVLLGKKRVDKISSLSNPKNVLIEEELVTHGNFWCGSGLLSILSFNNTLNLPSSNVGEQKPHKLN